MSSTAVRDAAAKAYGLRYQLMTYLYGALYLAHVKGGTVAQPLFFTDPSDRGARCVCTQYGTLGCACWPLSWLTNVWGFQGLVVDRLL